MTRENKIKVGIIVTFLIIFGISLYIYNFFHKPKLEEVNPYGMQDVMEYGMFFSSVNNINKYLFYNYSKNTTALLNILNKDYLQSNNINNSNILNKLDIINTSSFFQAKKMYYKEIDDNYIYYIIGDIIADGHDKTTIYKENVEYLLIVDYHNFTIEIYPLEAEDEKIDLPFNNTINIMKNNFNSFEKSNLVTDDYVCNLYYSQYYNLLVNNLDKAYEVLDETFKTDNFPNKDSYDSFISSNLNNISPNIKSCNLTTITDKRTYLITDMADNQFEFYENKIMDYNVKFTFNK